MEFDFLVDWQAGHFDVRLDSHQATMANLTIKVDDKVFTANEPLRNDEERDEPRNFVTVSVFPLAEFIAANWWALLHEPLEKENLLIDSTSFKLRHWINKHTDGFSYPMVGFFGADTSIRIAAIASHIESANIQFPIISGEASTKWGGIERNVVETSFLKFLTATAERLPQNADREWLMDAVQRIKRSRYDTEEAAYCRCAGLLGADPYDPSDELEAAITHTVSILGEGVAVELFATAETSDVANKASWLDEQTRSIICKSKEVAAHAHGLKAALGGSVQRKHKPWDRGYETARQLRTILEIPLDKPLNTIDATTYALLGCRFSDSSIIDGMEAACGVRGVARESSEGLGIAIDTKSGRNPQFQIASTFSDFIFSEGDDLFLTTGISTDRQKCNRAFAAEFLAPIDGIKQKLLTQRKRNAGVQEVARYFGVSTHIIRYQLQNQAPELFESN